MSPDGSESSGATTSPNPDDSIEPGSVTDRIIDNGNAISRIAAARCDREASCNRIGENGNYDTESECTADQSRAERAAIGAKVCPEAVDREKLNACLAAIRTEDCQSSLEDVEQMTVCRSHALCISP